MEGVYHAARANLRRLMGLHPHWTHQQYAQNPHIFQERGVLDWRLSTSRLTAS